MRSSWITHKGQKIFLADYNSMNYEMFQEEMIQSNEEIIKMPSGSVRSLIDIRGMIITPRELDLFKKYSQIGKPYLCKTAVLGIAGPRKIMLDIVVKFSGVKVTTFDDMEKAKDWLAE